jgi:predicted 2-oxoglutarate/Fe(II)-dependent dioxygenase YbiX
MSLKVNGFFPGELKPDTTVAGCIDIFENVWPSPHEAIAMAEKAASDPESGAYWERAGTIGHGAYQNARTNMLMQLSHVADLANNLALQNIHNQFNMLLLAAAIPHGQRFGIEQGLWHEGYNLLKYRTGEEYKSHYDGTSQTGRAVSAICYLNDDYEGGELEFPNFGIKIKPEAGMLMLFPSNYAYRHIAHPITKGTKYSLVTWLRDRQGD